MLKFMGPLVVVEDIATSRRFYERLLGQQVQHDFGVNIAFEGGLSIHQRAHFQGLLGDTNRYPITKKAHNGELYFETDEIERLYAVLEQSGTEFIHPIVEQPWGQRAMRLYDPDGHIVEIGEMMDAAIWRLHGQGWTIDRICGKTGLPREFIERAIQERDKAGQTGNG